MRYLFKIFEEGKCGPLSLENEMNDYFLETDGEIVSVNIAVETVDGIDYKSVIVCYSV